MQRFGRIVATGWIVAGCSEYRGGEAGVDAPDSRYCLDCHGGAGESAGPFRDTKGRDATSYRGAGAHQAHVTDARLASAIACGTCHAVPEDADDPGHMDSALPAEVAFSGVARERGADPVLVNAGTSTVAYDEFASLRCDNVYCHGATLSGGRAKSPTWNGAPEALAGFSSCDACHGFPPAKGRHSSVFEEHAFLGKNCTYCHQGVANATGTAIVGPDRHVNGTLDVALSGGTWNPDTRTCRPACHGPETW